MEKELLDKLPFDHPDALRSRRDLQLLNALMGNHRRMARAARKIYRPSDRLLELGAGQGELSAKLRAVLPHLARVDALDLCPPPKDWPSHSRWHRADATTFTDFNAYDWVVTNLLLHQFSDEQLGLLGQRFSTGPRVILAAEPSRRHRHLLQLRALGLFALGRVTRHDGAISIRAGFRGNELPHLLGLNPEQWQWRCHEGLLGQYFMLAERID